MGKGLVRRFGCNRVLVLAAIGAVAASAFAMGTAAAASGPAGPHMSPNLTAVRGPAVSTLALDATHKACLFSPPYTCYGPYDMAKVYNFPAHLDGRGQTIIIVDAYGSPTIMADLATFDHYFGVPAPRSFTVIAVPGTGVTGSGALTSWQVETSLDVEYAHAMAPGANIVLAVAATDNNFDLNAAEAKVLPLYPGAIVSQSFGDWETDATAGTSFAEQHKIFQAANRLGDTCSRRRATQARRGPSTPVPPHPLSPRIRPLTHWSPASAGRRGTRTRPDSKSRAPTVVRQRGTSRRSAPRQVEHQACSSVLLPGSAVTQGIRPAPSPMSRTALR